MLAFRCSRVVAIGPCCQLFWEACLASVVHACTRYDMGLVRPMGQELGYLFACELSHLTVGILVPSHALFLTKSLVVVALRVQLLPVFQVVLTLCAFVCCFRACWRSCALTCNSRAVNQTNCVSAERTKGGGGLCGTSAHGKIGSTAGSQVGVPLERECQWSPS